MRRIKLKHLLDRKKIVNKIYYCIDGYLEHKWHKRQLKSGVSGKVLIFHHVSNEPLSYVTYRGGKCTIEQFTNVLNKNTEQGYNFIDIATMLDFISRKETKKFAVITFDDVPFDFYYNAYPVLKKKSIPFTLFLVSNYIGEKGYLSKDQVMELSQDSLCTIGSHTLTHPILRKTKNAKQELADSKQNLETMIGKPVQYFAYPYGRRQAVSGRIIRLAKKVGYKCAFSTLEAPITDYAAKHRFYLPRKFEM